jgi:thioredoxin 1
MASQNVTEVTSDNWDQEVIQADKPVLVDFWAPWCAPCRQLTPTIDKIANDFAGRGKVVKLNTEDGPEIAARFRISAIPQLLVFNQGQEAERIVGLKPETSIVQMLNRVLGV